MITLKIADDEIAEIVLSVLKENGFVVEKCFLVKKPASIGLSTASASLGITTVAYMATLTETQICLILPQKEAPIDYDFLRGKSWETEIDKLIGSFQLSKIDFEFQHSYIDINKNPPPRKWFNGSESAPFKEKNWKHNCRRKMRNNKHKK